MLMKQNHLAQESSPYLKQHVNNPVDWYHGEMNHSIVPKMNDYHTIGQGKI